MTTVTAGLVGGLAATIVMMVMGDEGPPRTARLVAKVAGGDPDDHAMPGVVLHLLYGIVVYGVVLGAFVGAGILA